MNVSHQIDQEQINFHHKEHFALQQGEISSQPHQDPFNHQETIHKSRNYNHNTHLILVMNSRSHGKRNQRDYNYDSEGSDEEEIMVQQW